VAAAESFSQAREINILWLTAGLGCDGDTIAMTAARLPGIKDGTGRLPELELRTRAGIPLVDVPGCPVLLDNIPDNIKETPLYLCQAAGCLDEALRPTWLFGATVYKGCDRGGYYQQGDFAGEYGSPECIVKLGCERYK
jgi:Ni,Fe-hydrogenase I small subunit